jgi:hypothetical protein
MSIDDERELRRRLDSALDAVTPSPAPVPATLRRGRTIRIRRRVGVAAGLAAAIGITLAAPGLVRQIVRQQPVTPNPQKWVLTVHPPGLHRSRGEIAWGTINGKRWQITVQGDGAGPNGQCIEVDQGNPSSCAPRVTASQDLSAAVLFNYFGQDGMNYVYGVVQPAVARVVITLADRTNLTLHPYPRYGQRWVAFPVPAALAIVNAAAYSAQSELAHAIPFGDTFTTWLGPGASGLPRATYVIGSGVLNHAAWSDVMHVGPWGYCPTIALSGGTGQSCVSAQAPLESGNSYYNGMSDYTSGAIIEGTASASVSYVVGTLSDGGTIRAQAVDTGGPKFWAWAVPKGQRLRRVVFYSASGREVAMQSGAGYNKVII